MNDAEYARQKARVLAAADRWLKPLGLLWWHVEHVWYREHIPGGDTGRRAADGWQAVAQTKALWQYGRVQFEWNLAMIAEMGDGEVERVFVHECCHALVHEMREWGTEHEDGEVITHEERVVTSLTKAFFWVRSAGEEDALTILSAPPATPQASRPPA